MQSMADTTAGGSTVVAGAQGIGENSIDCGEPGNNKYSFLY